MLIVLGKPTLKKRIERSKLVEYIYNISPCTIVMEACGGSNYWARVFQKSGHCNGLHLKTARLALSALSWPKLNANIIWVQPTLIATSQKLAQIICYYVAIFAINLG